MNDTNPHDNVFHFSSGYEENEPIGCPGEGHVSGTGNVIASEACCHCRTIDERADRPHGKGQVEG